VSAADAAPALPAAVSVLPPAARAAAGLLRASARASLLGMVAAVLFGNDTMRMNTLAQIRMFAALFLAPEAAAWLVLRAFGARASIENGVLVLARGARRLELALRDIVAVEPWRVPIPASGARLRLASGERWRYGLVHADPFALAHALAAAGGTPVPQYTQPRATLLAQARAAFRPSRLDRPFAKFVLFPLVLAIPAFRLHQHIAYGSTFGEYHAFGLAAYLAAFVLWGAAWAIAVVLCAAAVRAAIEIGALLAVVLRPERAVGQRCWLERFGRVAIYLGMPTWLLLRILGT
jgi:apolipoprotein N-acyltransferase